MSASNPLVTVVIATYNKSSTLRYAVKSVLNQSFQDFELLVIGDACTDDSEEVVNSFNDPRVHWYNLPENSGYASVPNNEGIRRGKGLYIAYLNHDDLWMPNHLEELVTHIEATKADFVFSIMAMFFEYEDPWAWIPHYPHAPLVAESSHTLHRKDVIEDLGYWKLPHETSSWPRREYFRRAEITGKVFSFVPILSVLKIVSGSKYDELGRQRELFEKIQHDPDFANRVLSRILASTHDELERPVRLSRLGFQIRQAIKRGFLKRGIDPANLRFWRKLGQDIEDWRKDHGLDLLSRQENRKAD